MILLVELKGAPRHIHKRIRNMKYTYKDTIIDVIKSRATNTTRVIIKETPKGWWLALRVKMKAPSRLYRLVEMKELDLPSILLKASLKRRWTLTLERNVSKALKEVGLLG